MDFGTRGPIYLTDCALHRCALRLPECLALEVGATPLSGDSGKTHGKEHGRDIEPRVGKVWAAREGVIVFTFFSYLSYSFLTGRLVYK